MLKGVEPSVVELNHGVFREALGQIIGQCLRPKRIPCQGQRQRRSILHIPTRRKREGRCGSPPGFGGSANEGFPQRRSGFVTSDRFLLLRSLGRGQCPITASQTPRRPFPPGPEIVQPCRTDSSVL